MSCLESSTSWFGFIEQRFVKEQGTLIVTAVVVEISASWQMETLSRAPDPAQILDTGRSVRAAISSFRVRRFTYLRWYNGGQQ